MIDVFAGTGDAVPTALTDALTGLRLVDHHVHGVFREPLSRAEFEAALNEGTTGPVPSGISMFDSPVGLAVRRWCAPLLDLPPHASGDDYWEARSALAPDELARRLLPEAGVDRWLVDAGHASDAVTSPDELAALGGGTASTIVRLESLVESLAHEPGFPDAFRARLAELAPTVVAAKTIAAYRTGLDVDWARPADAEVAARAAAHHGRLNDPVLIAFAAHTAIDMGLPLQVHTGLGDRDLDLHRADPMLLLPLLRGRPDARVLLLHCWPFHRQAGYLAQAFDGVCFDVGLAVTQLGAGSVGLVRESLELAPYATQLYSSDGFGLPELHLLGSVLWRRSAGLVLGESVRRGDVTEDDACRIVAMIGAENAVRVYSK